MVCPLPNRLVSALAILALVLQIVVPKGYMPAAVNGGWYLQLCPDGLSMEVMTALLGHHSHHHHHHGETESRDTKPCELAGLYADALDAPEGSSAVQTHRAYIAPAYTARDPRHTPRRPYDSRAPPLS